MPATPIPRARPRARSHVRAAGAVARLRTLLWLPPLCTLTLAAGCLAPDSDVGPWQSDCALTVCPDGATIDGIDVSYWQGEIDWPTVANSGVEFAFIRVADGFFIDPEFQDNWASARNEGVVRGAYQYFRAGDDASDQADDFLAEMGPLLAGDLPPVLDVETTDGQSLATVNAGIQEWMDTVMAEIGRPPLIYTSPGLWPSVSGSQAFGGHPLWVAHWFAACPDVPSPWTDWVFWQTSDSGSVPGISGDVDLNVFNGNVAELMDFAVAGGGDPPICGDGHCDPGEDHDSCPDDCPGCDEIPPDGRTIDEQDLCYERGGNPSYWYSASGGHDGSLDWTHTTDDADAENYGVWDLEFVEHGVYRIEAYTAAPHAQSQQAAYQVHHHGVTDVVAVDQTTVDGWALLGEFNFDPGADQWVRLDDNTGEPYNGGQTRIVFDAIRLTRTDGSGDDDDDTAADDDDTGPADDDDTGPADDDDTAADDDDAGDDDTFGPQNTDDDLDKGGRDRGAAGCQCRAAPRGAGALTTPGLLALLVALRRRRAA